MEAPKISLKLLVDAKARKVIFAEAGKDFVDFLFHLLSLQVGTIIRLLTNKTMVGCIGNLYQSIENFNEAYMQPNQNKDLLLKPNAPDSVANVPLLLPVDCVSLADRKFYNCVNNHRYVTSNPGVTCPGCRSRMSIAVTYVAPGNATTTSNVDEGHVKGLVTYLVTDDLLVTEFDTLEEKVVEFGIDEVLKLLKASLLSKAGLTRVFLGEKGIKDTRAPKSHEADPGV